MIREHGSSHNSAVGNVIDPTEKPLDAVFNGPPSEAPIKQVVESCGYTFGVVPTPEPAPPAPPTP